MTRDQTAAEEDIPAAPATGVPVLEVRGVHKWFGGVHALDDVSLKLYAGETVALVGDNGAGKSTLVRTIVGVHRPDQGEILLDGEPVHFHTPKAARSHGIETVYQDLALVDTFDIPSNFFLGREITYGRWIPIMKRKAMRARAQASISDLKVSIPGSDAKVAQMSGGQRQGVSVARAAFWDARVLLLDEPTAALGVRESGQVSRLLKELSARGASQILISHKMEEVFRLSDTIVVLRQGKHIATTRTVDATPQQVVGWITGAETVGL